MKKLYKESRNKLYYYKEAFKLLFQGINILVNSQFYQWEEQFYRLKKCLKY